MKLGSFALFVLIALLAFVPPAEACDNIPLALGAGYGGNGLGAYDLARLNALNYGNRFRGGYSDSLAAALERERLRAALRRSRGGANLSLNLPLFRFNLHR